MLRGDDHNFAPRFGLAYRPWSQHSLVLRAGYGLFYDGSIYSRLYTNMASQPPFAQASTLVTTPKEVLTLENGFPKLGPNILTNNYALDPNFRTPYAQTWNFSIEDEFVRNVILSLGYVGTKGTKLDLLLAPNQSPPGAPITTGAQTALQNTLAFTYETSGAASIYHGLQVGLRRQFHGGFSMSGTYTFSKSIDDAASVGGAGRTVAQNYLDLQAERGLSSFDVRNKLLINHIYQLPFGEQRRWLNKGGTMGRVFGNWQISGITTIQSGTPYDGPDTGQPQQPGGDGSDFQPARGRHGSACRAPSFAADRAGFLQYRSVFAPGGGRIRRRGARHDSRAGNGELQYVARQVGDFLPRAGNSRRLPHRIEQYL